MNKALLSSKSSEWETPRDFYNFLDKKFHFEIDPCATYENKKCPMYFSIAVDGLSVDWGQRRYFMNPPYGYQIRHWIRKAYESSLNGALVVCLIPARTDTSYWHTYCMRGTIYLIRGRLKFTSRTFVESNGDLKLVPAPFPCALVIFGDGYNDTKVVRSLNWKGRYSD